MLLWRVVQRLIELCHERAYVEVTLSLHGGRVVMVKETRSFKPEDVPVIDGDAGRKHLHGLPY